MSIEEVKCPEIENKKIKYSGCPEIENKKIKYSGYLSGHIKWIDHKRGFGFVEVEYEGETKDAFLHVSLLKDNEPLPDLTPVKVILADTDRGLKVIKVSYMLKELDDE